MTNKQKSAYSDALIHQQKHSRFSYGDSTRSSQSITQRCQLTSSTIQRTITSKESKCQHKDSELPVKGDDGGGDDDDEREHNFWAPLSLFSQCWSELEACERWCSSSSEASGGGGFKGEMNRPRGPPSTRDTLERDTDTNYPHMQKVQRADGGIGDERRWKRRNKDDTGNPKPQCWNNGDISVYGHARLSILHIVVHQTKQHQFAAQSHRRSYLLASPV